MDVKKLITITCITTGLLNVANASFAQTGQPSSTGSAVQSLTTVQDQQFITKAAQSNLAEIRASQLALQKTTNSQVRNMATSIIQDHTRANADLAPIATRSGVPMPTEPDARQQMMLSQLSELSGTAFDQAYVQQMAQAHQDAITLYRAQSTQTSNPELRAYTLNYLPGLETHLASLQQQSISMEAGQTDSSSQTSAQDDTQQSTQAQGETTETRTTERRSAVRGYW